MCVQLNALSDECLLLTFDRVPLSDLVHLGRVCRRWACLLPNACARRRTLVLFFGEDGLSSTDYGYIPLNDHLKISFDGGLFPYYNLSVPELDAYFEISPVHGGLLSGQLVTYMTDLFPNVDTLVLIHSDCYEDQLHFLIDLLLSSSWSLRILKLWLQTWDIDPSYRDRPEQHPIGTLLGSINQLSSLRELSLNIDGMDDIDGRDREFAFPLEFFAFIARLNVLKIYLGNYDRDNMIWDIVHRFDNAQLRLIGLGNDCAHSSTDTSVLKPQLKFTTKVRQHYGLNLEFDTVGQLSEFCGRYSSLTMLQIQWSASTTFTQLVANLASLTQLTHLKLGIDFVEHPENAFAFVSEVDDGDEQVEEPLPQISLPQVKNLELDVYRRSHVEFESLSPLVFPAVEVIILYDDHPEKCLVCPNVLTFVDVANRRCHRLLILSLQNKFTNPSVRLYVEHTFYDSGFVDRTNYARAEDDDDVLSEIDDANQQREDLLSSIQLVCFTNCVFVVVLLLGLFITVWLVFFILSNLLLCILDELLYTRILNL